MPESSDSSTSHSTLGSGVVSDRNDELDNRVRALRIATQNEARLRVELAAAESQEEE